MVAKVHGGVYKDQVLAGSLRAVVVSGTDVGAGVATADSQTWTLKDGTTAVYNTGDAIPSTLTDLVYRVVASRATVVSVELKTGEMHMLLENASAWGYDNAYGDAADLDDALAELDGATYSKVGGAVGTVSAAPTSAFVRLVFETTSNAETAPLGGNEH